MDMPNWDHLRTFLAVIDRGSLSAAARDLGITQPTAGRHIGDLEAATGHSLFLRTASGLFPNEQAEALVPHARAMAYSAAAFARTASGMTGQVSGTVRISASEIVGVEILPQIIATLQARHPELTVELSATDAVEDLLKRQADVAIRMTEPRQDALVVKFIGVIQLGFHATKSYLETHGVPESLDDLGRHRLVGFDRQSAYLRAMADRFPAAASARFTFRADSNLAQFAAIRAGCGIGMCQINLARRHEDLVHVLTDFRLPLPTWVAMHEDMKSTPRCRVAFDALVAGLQTLAAPQE